MHMMNDMFIHVMHSRVYKFKIVADKKNTRHINKKKFCQYINAPWAKYYKHFLRKKDVAHSLWCDVSVKGLLLMESAGKLQNLLLTGVEVGFKSIPFFFELYPTPLQFFP